MTISDLVPWKRKRGDIRVGRDYDDMFGSFYREMHNLMDRFFHGFDLDSFDTGSFTTGEFIPRVDVKENDKEIKITAELPGMDEKNINVTVSGDSITIQGEKQEEIEDKSKDYYRSECKYGTFHRIIPFSAEVDESKVEANFKKGVLKIRLPKTAEAQKKRRKIQIKTE